MSQSVNPTEPADTDEGGPDTARGYPFVGDDTEGHKRGAPSGVSPADDGPTSIHKNITDDGQEDVEGHRRV